MRKLPDGQKLDPEAIQTEIDRASAAIDRFAAAMKDAMARKAREGRTGWDDPALRADIVNDMIAHAICADKTPGQEVHVANFAMMLHLLNEPIEV
jgi:hypothetical protein